MEKQVSNSNSSVSKLNDLKVAQLRLELEKRNLDKTGVKANLVDRLRKALLAEGEDPEEFSIETPGTKTINRKKMSEETEEIESDDEEAENVIVSDEENSQNCENTGETLQLSIGDEEIHLNEEEENSVDVYSKDTDEESTNCRKEPTITSEKVDSSRDEKAGSLNERPNGEENPASSEGAEETVDNGSSTVTLISNKAVNSNPTAKPKAASGKIIKVLGKDDKIKRVAVTARNLWISGLASTTKAADLRALFTKQGKVISAKIVTNAKHVTGSKKYFGFVTMSTSKDASKCIQTLHRTELNGRTISVERTRHEPGTLLKRTEARTAPTKKVGAKGEIKSVAAIKPATEAKKAIPIASTSKTDKESNDSKENETLDDAETDDKEPKEDKVLGREKDREHRSRDYNRDDREYHRAPFRPFGFRGRARGRGFMFRDRPQMDSFRRPFVRRQFFGRPSFRPPLRPRFLTFDKIRDEHLSERDHFREREIRESERRSAQEAFRHKLIERKQREEAYRLEREKDFLRMEREMLERERAEILKAEREKQRMERERLEREKEELRHQVPIRYSQKKQYPVSGQVAEPIWEERKRADPRYEAHPTYHKEGSGERKRKYEFQHTERPSYSRSDFEHPQRFDKKPNVASTHDFKEHREPRREVTLRVQDDRRIYKRSDIRGRGNERSYHFRETERHAPPKHVPSSDWKTHERRVSNSSGRDRPYY